METLLIGLFVVLFVYLVFQMCRESDEGESPVRREKDFDKSAAVFDRISDLEDRDLYRIKDELYDLKSILDKGAGSIDPAGGAFRKTAAGEKTKGGKRSLRKILHELNQMEGGIEPRKPSFSKFHMAIIQALLVLITIFVILL